MIEQEITLLTNGRISFQKCGNGLQFGYSKNRGVYSIKVKTSGEWNGLTIRAFWHVPDGKDPASSLVVDGYVDVPASVTAQPGSGCLTFEGSDGTKTVTSADLRYRVSANSGTEDGTEPEPGTPAWQQLVDAVHADATAAEQAKTDARKSADEAKQALEDTKNVKDQAIENIGIAKDSAIEGIEDKKSTSIEEINKVKESAKKELEDVCNITEDFANQAKESADKAKVSELAAKESEAKSKISETNSKASEDASKKNADDSAATLQELKDGIASGNFKGDKGDTGPQGPQGEPGPDNLVIITATANVTVQGEYTPDTTYSNALADIQANKAVMIKLDNVPGRYYIPYSSSNAEILASAGTVSGSNQSIELYLIKWTAQTNTITLTGTKEGCIADGGTAGQVLVKKSDDSFDTEWQTTLITYENNATSITFDEAQKAIQKGCVLLLNKETGLTYVLNKQFEYIRGFNFIAYDNDILQGLFVTWINNNISFYAAYETVNKVPSGGTSGQVLTKKSDSNYDIEWKDAEAGKTVSVNVGTTTTSEAGTNATVTNSGDETNVVLNFTIPRGEQGPAGPIGPQGPQGEIPEDYPQIREDVSKLKEDTAALQKRQNILIGTETGNPIAVDDAFSAPLCGLTVYGKSTQDGTPSPDAPVPIVSAGDSGSVAVKVTGKNLLYIPDVEERTVNGVTYSVKNGVIKIKGTSQGKTVRLVRGIKLFVGTWFFDPNPVKGAESLNCYLDLTNTINRGFSLASGAASKPLKLPEVEVKYPFNLNIESTAGSVIDMEWQPQMLLSDKLLPYSPYREQLLTLPTPNGLPGIPVTSGGNYTDSTGQQWVCDEVDLERGVKVQRIGKERVNTSDGGINEQYRLALDIPGNEGKDGAFPCIISITPYTPWTSCVAGTKLYLKNITKSEGSFYTAEELKALAIDVDFVYQLATPIETPLTPDEIAAYKALTAYGPDTVMQASDGAGVKLEYQRDVNIAIKRIEDAVASMT